MRHAWLLFVAGMMAIATRGAFAQTVQTGSGTIQGISTANAQEYLGIPYAAPPVGLLRWAAPQPAVWSGVLQAKTLPPACPQPAGPVLPQSTDENCLFLNVYAPLAPAAKPLPVMVWVHGGAYYNGTGSQYDGTALVQDGVIVVTMNYRLGYLGFLAHPALDAETPAHASGDYGLMDQQAALHWVQTNIAAFGGDPARVTLFGQSTGGQAVTDQLVSPMAAGLFQRLIVESGAFDIPLPTLAAADTSGVAFANSVGCTNQTDAACLRALPVSAVLAAETAVTSGGGVASSLQFQPNIGTPLLPVQPLIAVGTGRFNHVPVLQGSNHDEARLFTEIGFDFVTGPLTSATYNAAISSVAGAQFAPLVGSFYPLSSYPSPDLAFSALFTDAGFACSAREFDQLLSFSVPTYAYEFADENAGRLVLPPDPFLALGAPHTSELPFLWPNYLGPLGPGGFAFTPDEQGLALQMRAAWTNFAKNANPNGDGVTTWPAYSAFTDRFQELVPAATSTTTGFAGFHKCNLWEPLLTYRVLQ